MRAQAREAAAAAGAAPALLYARLDIARFRALYEARMRWALLDRLAYVDAAAPAAAPPPEQPRGPEEGRLDARALLAGAGRGEAPAAAEAGPALADVEAVVRRVAVAVLGAEAVGGAPQGWERGDSGTWLGAPGRTSPTSMRHHGGHRLCYVPHAECSHPHDVMDNIHGVVMCCQPASLTSRA